jgi:hypothetical protein
MGRVSFIILFILTLSFSQTYKTYYPWESDSVLVAWAIKNFVDKNASFMSVDKKKEKISKENSINTPNSKLRRTARFTAFEMALNHYKIEKSECIKKLGRVIRVLEMTPWKKDEFGDIVAFERDLVSLFPQKVGDGNLSKVFDYIDSFCKGSI